MTPQESAAWRPEIKGWAADILPWIELVVPSLPVDACCVEVGVFHGRSLIYLAESLTRHRKHYASAHGFDPGEDDPSQRYDKAEPGQPANVLWPSRKELAANLERSRGDRTVEVCTFTEPSPAAARWYEDDSLSYVFLDGDHREAAVRADIAAWWPKLKSGGILAGHDYGHPIYPGVKAAVDNLCAGVEVREHVWWRRIG